jgi:hypothetical protein
MSSDRQYSVDRCYTSLEVAINLMNASSEKDRPYWVDRVQFWKDQTRFAAEREGEELPDWF